MCEPLKTEPGVLQTRNSHNVAGRGPCAQGIGALCKALGATTPQPAPHGEGEPQGRRRSSRLAAHPAAPQLSRERLAQHRLEHAEAVTRRATNLPVAVMEPARGGHGDLLSSWRVGTSFDDRTRAEGLVATSLKPVTPLVCHECASAVGCLARPRARGAARSHTFCRALAGTECRPAPLAQRQAPFPPDKGDMRGGARRQSLPRSGGLPLCDGSPLRAGGAGAARAQSGPRSAEAASVPHGRQPLGAELARALATVRRGERQRSPVRPD